MGGFIEIIGFQPRFKRNPPLHPDPIDVCFPPVHKGILVQSQLHLVIRWWKLRRWQNGLRWRIVSTRRLQPDNLSSGSKGNDDFERDKMKDS